MKLTSNLLIALLLGLAVSIEIGNNKIQSELNELKKEEIQREWVKAGVEISHENKALNVVGNDGNK